MEIAYLDAKCDHELDENLASRRFTVIIPAYNEEKRILPVLSDICKFIVKNSVPWKVLVMIDGDDRTRDVVRDFRKEHAFVEYVKEEGRNGKGGAVKRAVDFVSSEFVILMDADNSVSFNQIIPSVHLLRDNDMVILSRYESKRNSIPAFRRFISRGFNLLLRMMLNIEVKDTQSGYKLIRTTVFKEVMSRITTTDAFFDVAMLYYMNGFGAKILEVPVDYDYNCDSTFHPIAPVIGLGISLIAFKLRQTKLFRYVPTSFVNLYYQKFKWM